MSGIVNTVQNAKKLKENAQNAQKRLAKPKSKKETGSVGKGYVTGWAGKVSCGYPLEGSSALHLLPLAQLALATCRNLSC